FLITVFQGNNAYSWKITPRWLLGSKTSSPSTSTLPDVFVSRPAIIFSNVLFPQPLGPRTQTNSLSLIFKFKSCIATTSTPFPANVLFNSFISTLNSLFISDCVIPLFVLAIQLTSFQDKVLFYP